MRKLLIAMIAVAGQWAHGATYNVTTTDANLQSAALYATNAGAGGTTNRYAMVAGTWQQFETGGGGGGSSYDDTALVLEAMLADYRLAVLEDAASRSALALVRDWYTDTNSVAWNTNAHWTAGIPVWQNYASSSAAGGVETTSGTNYIHLFTNSGTFVVSDSVVASVLVVAGGGSGGSQGGGGGAGGLLYTSAWPIAAGTYTITVGAGGPASGVLQTSRGNNGDNSSFGALMVAQGGGGGGSRYTAAVVGGSGGGANGNQGAGAAGISGQGCAGATGYTVAENSGGGGGAGGVGIVGSNGVAGAGGPGLPYAIRAGTNEYYAGGGGGSLSVGTTTVGAGGVGGGGAGGAQYGGGVAPVAGTANTGGGGGGASYQYASAAGGSGIVIISYPSVSSPATNASITSSFGLGDSITRVRPMLLHETFSGTLGTNLQMSVGASGACTNDVALGLQGASPTAGVNIYTGDCTIAATTSLVYQVRMLGTDVYHRLHATSMWIK